MSSSTKHLKMDGAQSFSEAHGPLVESQLQSADFEYTVLPQTGVIKLTSVPMGSDQGAMVVALYDQNGQEATEKTTPLNKYPSGLQGFFGCTDGASASLGDANAKATMTYDLGSDKFANGGRLDIQISGSKLNRTLVLSADQTIKTTAHITASIQEAGGGGGGDQLYFSTLAEPDTFSVAPDSFYTQIIGSQSFRFADAVSMTKIKMRMKRTNTVNQGSVTVSVCPESSPGGAPNMGAPLASYTFSSTAAMPNVDQVYELDLPLACTVAANARTFFVLDDRAVQSLNIAAYTYSAYGNGETWASVFGTWQFFNTNDAWFEVYTAGGVAPSFDVNFTALTAGPGGNDAQIPAFNGTQTIQQAITAYNAGAGAANPIGFSGVASTFVPALRNAGPNLAGGSSNTQTSIIRSSVITGNGNIRISVPVKVATNA